MAAKIGMTVPILQPQPSPCLACKGPLTADHKHEYVDTKFLEYVDNLIGVLSQQGCILLMSDGDLLPVHMQLIEGYAWTPVAVTHIAPHDDCTVRIPHHHCAVDTVERDGSDEIPDAPLG